MKVFQPELALEAKEGEGVLLENHSPYEINLSKWRLDSALGHFAFPEDTIVAAKSSVEFPDSITRVGISGQIDLSNPSGRIASSYIPAAFAGSSTLPVPVDVPADIPASDAAALRVQKISEIRQRLADIESQIDRHEASAIRVPSEAALRPLPSAKPAVPAEELSTISDSVFSQPSAADNAASDEAAGPKAASGKVSAWWRGIKSFFAERL